LFDLYAESRSFIVSLTAPACLFEEIVESILDGRLDDGFRRGVFDNFFFIVAANRNSTVAKF